MAKQLIPFSSFVDLAGIEHTEYIDWLDQFMTQNDYTSTIKESASGYVVSYVHKETKRTVANYVFRKKGLMLRVYADYIANYMNILDKWPAAMKNTIKKAGPCKRLLNPDACNPRCRMGFDFILEGERQQKCRNNGFMFLLDDETKPYLKELIEHEIQARKA